MFFVSYRTQKLVLILFGEALMYGKKVCITPLPYIEELSLTNENSAILDFDLKNIKDVVEKLKSFICQNNSNAIHYGNVLQDNYKKYLAKGKSHYEKEMKDTMKKIRAKVKFKDMMCRNLLRYKGDEFIVDDARAKDLIERGFAELVEEINPKEQAIEKAVKKETKKEKAVVEKATKKTTAPKKNAKE